MFRNRMSFFLTENFSLYIIITMVDIYNSNKIDYVIF